MDRALAFYTGVLPFEVVFEVEVQGDAYEHLFGVFGMRARIVRLRLGEEEIELIDYLAPEGRPVPVDSRSNDEWFQPMYRLAFAQSFQLGLSYAPVRYKPSWKDRASCASRHLRVALAQRA
jgi:catechol 2,3-dioxygenase-like lactoylglutathione lyase family enzyme